LVVIVTDDNVHELHAAHWMMRRTETKNAMMRLGLDVVFMGVLETDFKKDTADHYLDRIRLLNTIREPMVFAPDFPNIHPHHQLVGEWAKKTFKNVLFYPTAGWDKKTTPKGEVVETFTPTDEERLYKKNLLNDCYWWQNFHHSPIIDSAVAENEYLTKL
jgi:LmbE family N-acetylglucosaminyl deacetylase